MWEVEGPGLGTAAAIVAGGSRIQCASLVLSLKLAGCELLHPRASYELIVLWQHGSV